MRKFAILLKKEIQGLITPQVILSVVIMVIVFVMLGGILKDQFAKMSEEAHDLRLAQLPSRPITTTGGLIAYLNEQGIPAFEEDDFSPRIFENPEAPPRVLVFPSDFVEHLLSPEGESPEITLYLSLRNTAGILQITRLVPPESFRTFLMEALRSVILTGGGGEQSPLLERYLEPARLREKVVYNGRIAAVSPDVLIGYLINQNTILVLLLFMVSLFGAQFVATSIATEKESKTLETLLSLPVPRSYIAISKMAAAGIMALLMVVIYLAGFTYYLDSFQGLQTSASAAQGSPDALSVTLALQHLGLVLPPWDELLRGLSYLLSLLNVLGIALILGLFAEDIRGVQVVVTPIMLVLLALYLLTLFLDVLSLPLLARLALYLFPFTHAFISTSLLLADDYLAVGLGLGYQTLTFVLIFLLTLRIFHTDRVLTLKLPRLKRR
ncbi:ABC transporter permease [Spirochaeta thermophila]|uniref:ABC-2 type transporter family n=1 Tax=Winmispira thermophila (strain ATCC 49972 / DSM 6192 / RI 19.B1) TaxID=665571 RepID=E0RNN5_WINT6|nr:ABC transporter permease [Spirochaeta thermophila]ADN02626.1 ABC-2 type transporter family [Spirochaeta thermophila DSM 6192]